MTLWRHFLCAGSSSMTSPRHLTYSRRSSKSGERHPTSLPRFGRRTFSSGSRVGFGILRASATSVDVRRARPSIDQENG